MLDPEELKRHLTQGITCHHLQVEGDGRHFQALIVSPEFITLSRVQRHQRVYQALGHQMKDDAVHALSLTTLTPEEWQAKQHG